MLTLTVKDNEFSFSGRSVFPTKEKNTLLKPYGKMIHNYGVVVELLPDDKQKSLFRQTFGCARLVHNDYLGQRIGLYKKDKNTLTSAQYKKSGLKDLKAEKPFLAKVDKFALESACENVDTAYKNFFEGRARFPRHLSRRKPNGNRYTTKYTNGNIALCYSGGPVLKLPKAGFVPFILPKNRTIGDLQPKGVRILKATIYMQNGRFFASLGMESVIDLPAELESVDLRDIYAGDAGLKEFLVYGNREFSTHVENPRFIRKHEKRLCRLQRAMSRRVYNRKTHTGSKNWEKARKLVAREQIKIANQRRDFQHKLSRKIADSCMVFVREDLNIKGMMKNHCLAKEIASVGWGAFFQKLEYKLKAKGGIVIKADRYFASSQTCSACGHQNPNIRDLKIRSWICPSCGAGHDRDENAKENLINYGISCLMDGNVTINDTKAA